jgi:hypothetical protein
MPEVGFRYDAALVPISDMHGDIADAFAGLHPAHACWLRDNAVRHRVTVYCWPDFLARMMCNRIGTIVCEFEVIVESEFAERFAAIKNARG